MKAVDTKKNRDLMIMIMALGDAYLEKGLFAEASKRYNQLLDLKIANKQLYTNLSKALIGLRKFDRQALEIYQRAIQYDPTNAEIYHVLADSFLRDKREDKLAIQIYEMSLHHQTPNYDNVAYFLSDHYFRQNNFVKCREVTTKILEKKGYHADSLQLYMTCSWKTGMFHEAINLLKKLIDTTEDNMSLLKQLCMTYLEKKFHGEIQGKRQRFSFIDRQLIYDHLNTYDEFKTMQSLSFYLELKRFLVDPAYWGNQETSETPKTAAVYAHQTEEEISAGQASMMQTNINFSVGREILPRLNSYEGMTGKNLASKSSLTFDDFQKQGASLFSKTDVETSSIDIPHAAEIVLTLRLTNYENVQQKFGDAQAEKLSKKLFSMLGDFLEKYQITQAWCTSNGMIVLATDILQTVSLAVDFLNKLNRYNFINEPQEQLHLAMGVHHCRESLGSKTNQTLRDLSTAIKLSTITEDNLSAEDRAVHGKVFGRSNRVFLSAKAYRQIKSSNRFKVNSIGQFTLRYLNENLSLHEISWRNPSDELKFGYIKKISRFELLAELGGRGAIKVYKAKDTNLQRFVILKVIQSDVFNALPANNPQKLEFYQFAKSLGQLNHPNIVTIYEVDEDQGLTYIAREFAEGVAFTDFFKNGNLFNTDRFIKIIYQLFKALQYAHRFGFLHLNLKPHNILIGNNDETKLTDFLIPGAVFNTPNTNDAAKSYYSPEQIVHNRGDHRSDIFSAGAIMYQVLSQKHPFTGNGFASAAEAIVQKSPPPPSELNKQVSRFCDALVLKCLEKQPEKRFESAEQIVNLLKKNFEKTLFSNFNFQIAQSRDSY